MGILNNTDKEEENKELQIANIIINIEAKWFDNLNCGRTKNSGVPKCQKARISQLSQELKLKSSEEQTRV